MQNAVHTDVRACVNDASSDICAHNRDANAHAPSLQAFTCLLLPYPARPVLPVLRAHLAGRASEQEIELRRVSHSAAAMPEPQLPTREVQRGTPCSVESAPAARDL